MLTHEQLLREMDAYGASPFVVNQMSLDFVNRLIAAERSRGVELCREIGEKHQQNEGTYAAGKKAGAFECADALMLANVGMPT
ncbi:hypothetical protein [Janthinobacterium sp. CAN_S7]|uniref:hypothetical protein n=1 Tax=Janthinobacterium sp. CAN_S7 TaxID=3071704 RepID=UPI00319E8B1E